MAFIPAASGTKGLPGPTERGIHHQASCRSYATWLKRMAPVPTTLVLLPKGAIYLGTPKYDSVGKVQDVLPSMLAQGRETGKRRGPFIPWLKPRGFLAQGV
jgi:hypothetical protein